MNTSNESNAQTDLGRVLAKITEIAEKSADGDYIYRGEQECYDKVCSSLYRIQPNREGIDFDINDFQSSILEEAKAYIGKTDNIDETDEIGILTELQHFGGKTNLIDFTENYLIALYFACDGSHDKEGRVILLKRESDDYEIRRPRRTINRVESQRSVFVESPTGFVEPDIEVTIPAELKQPLLYHLRKSLGISVETIYNDLHGFIRRGHHAEFLKGLTCQNKLEEAKTLKEKQEHCEDAIKHYTEALKLNDEYAGAYNNRGNAYADKGDFDRAIKDYSKVIDLNSKDAVAYYNRGNAYADKGDFGTAIADYSKAIELNPEYAVAYNNRGLAYADKGDFGTAIADYSKAIELNPDAITYNNRGNAYVQKGEIDRAIQDFDKAIGLNSKYAPAYCNRGEVWLHRQEWEKARADLTTAKEMGSDIVASFHNDYESVEEFEAQQDVQVPEDIKALLRRD